MKAQLECEKLKAEIYSLRRPVLHSPAFYTALAPVALAVIGVIFTWASGWFDVQRGRISNETAKLELERRELTAETGRQQTRLNTLEASLNSLRSEKITLTNQIANLEKEKGELRSAADHFSREAKRLSGSETNAAQAFAALQSAQQDRQRLTERLTAALIESGRRDALLRRAADFLIEDVRMNLTPSVSDTRADAHFREEIDLSGEIRKLLPDWHAAPELPYREPSNPVPGWPKRASPPPPMD